MASQTVIANLKTVFTVVTGPFSRGMKTIQAKLGDFLKKVGAATIRVAKFGAALAAAAAAGLTIWFKRTTASIDAMTKLSDALGINFKKLQVFHHAAKLAGVEAGTLDNSLRRMIQRVSEAAQGSGEAAGALAELGLEAGTLNRMAPDKAFLAIGDALKGVANQSDRVRLANDIFGRQGAELLNMLNMGSEEIARIEARLEAMGALLGRDVAKDIERFNDRMTMTGPVLKAAGNALLETIMPLIIELGDRLKDTGSGILPMVQNAIKKTIYFGIVGVAKFTNLVRQLALAWHEVRAAIEDVGAAVNTLAGAGIRSTADALKRLRVLNPGAAAAIDASGRTFEGRALAFAERGEEHRDRIRELGVLDPVALATQFIADANFNAKLRAADLAQPEIRPANDQHNRRIEQQNNEIIEYLRRLDERTQRAMDANRVETRIEQLGGKLDVLARSMMATS